jgi:hypothetical protein
MNKLIFNGPLNSLSFGNVSLNLLREIWKRKIPTGIFPIGDQVDISVYDSLDEKFKKWIQESIDGRFNFLSADTPSIKLWHLNGGEQKITSNSALLTFYELDSPTNAEVNIAKSNKKIIFTSNESRALFKKAGCDNARFVPLGLDEDFQATNKYFLEDKIHFGLIGKFEKRKHTALILKLWAEKFGNDDKYQLTCCINNPFFKQNQLQQLVHQALEGKRVWNINFLPFLKTNSEMNAVLNSINIDLSGLSGAEGWGLPSFNSCALGKWPIVLNCTSHKDWATDKNSILVEPTGKEPAYDGQFFFKGTPFNQGNISTFSKDSFLESTEKAVSLINNGVINAEGLKLRSDFSYSNTLDKILNIINE